MKRIISLGIMVADIVGKPIDRFPERGKLDLIDTLALHTGGCAVNTGISLAKMGVPTAVWGMVGNDGLGQFLIAELRKHHIDVRGVIISDTASTSSTMVLVGGDGERSFLHCAGANAAYTLDRIHLDEIEDGDLLHVAGAFLMPQLDGAPTVQLLEKARSRGAVTALDTVWDAKGRWMDLLQPCLAHLDYFVPSFEEAEKLTGMSDPEKIAGLFLDRGVGTVGLKLGDRGCLVKNRKESHHIRPFPVRPVDTTGAGDSWVAGFLYGVYHNLPLDACGRWGNAIGARCVEGLGAQGLVKTREDILALIQG